MRYNTHARRVWLYFLRQGTLGDRQYRLAPAHTPEAAAWARRQERWNLRSYQR